MLKNYLHYQDARIHYHRFGTGKKLLITLHGFGDRAQLFSVLAPALEDHYTVFALDLPFHGLTEWPRKEFNQTDLVAIFQLIRTTHGFEKFDLMAYSFGGRLVMSVLPKLRTEIEQLYLIAPDGIQTKWLFNINLMPRPFVRLWPRLLNDPDWFLRFLKKTYKVGVISKFIYDFTRNHISTPERRERLFGTWLSMSNFNPKPKKIKRLLQQYPIPTHLYFGTRDEVIPVSAGQWLSKNVDSIHLHIIEEGHLLVDEKLNQLLAFQLQQSK